MELLPLPLCGRVDVCPCLLWRSVPVSSFLVPGFLHLLLISSHYCFLCWMGMPTPVICDCPRVQRHPRCLVCAMSTQALGLLFLSQVFILGQTRTRFPRSSWLLGPSLHQVGAKAWSKANPSTVISVVPFIFKNHFITENKSNQELSRISFSLLCVFL